MEIIKQGDLSRLKHTKRFECRKCGCEFLADDNEYVFTGMSCYESFYKAYCPCCGHEVSLEE